MLWFCEVDIYRDRAEITELCSFMFSGRLQNRIRDILTSASGTIYQTHSTEIVSYRKKKRGKMQNKKMTISNNKDKTIIKKELNKRTKSSPRKYYLS